MNIDRLKSVSLFFVIVLILLSSNLFAQSNVGINNPTPHVSALLDLTSTAKGFLVPRMTSVQRTAIATPATGLLVYDATLNQFWYFDGTVWRALLTPTDAWTLAGNSAVATNFIGTTNASDFIMKTSALERMRILSSGKVGLGIAAPSVNLQVHDSTASANTIIKITNTVSGSSLIDGLELRMNNTNAAEILNRENTSLYFGTNGTDKMVIDNLGNVGVGILVPTAKFHVSGTVAIQDGTQGLNKVLTSDASGNASWQALSPGVTNAWTLTGNSIGAVGNWLGTIDAQALVIKTQNVERMRILPTPLGYVGIGQAAPNANLDVLGKVIIGGAGFSGAVAPAVNGAMIQGHTTVGFLAQNAPEVFGVNATGTERGVNGYSIDSTAAYFKSTASSVSATGAHAAYMYAAGATGSAAVLHTNNTNNAPSLKILNYGTGSGILAVSNNTSASNYASQIQQLSVTGGGEQILMSSASNTYSGLIISHAGTGKGIQIDVTNAANTNEGIRVNHAGTGDGIYVNKTAVSGDGINVSMSGTSSANGIEITHLSSSGYGMLISRSATNAVGARIAMTSNSPINSSIGFQIQNDSKDPNARGETIVTDSAAGLWVKQGGAGAPAPIDPVQLSITTGGGLNINTAYPRGTGILASGVAHGIVAGSWDYDNLATTDHDGGNFYVRNNTNTNSIAASTVACRIAGTTYKILGLGTVSTLVPDMSNQPRIMAAPESPEILFQDFGRGKLVNGQVHITLDPIFSKNIHVDADSPLDVFVQLKGNCAGVYVANANQFGFDVIELNSGKSNVEFSYFVSARRADEMIGGVKSDNSGRFKPMTNPAFFYGNYPIQDSGH